MKRNIVSRVEADAQLHDWEGWVRTHAGRLLLFARQQARNEMDAADLVQQAVVECWQRNRDERPPALPLVYATIRRRAVDAARSENRRARREAATEDPTETEWFDTAVEHGERAALVQRALQRLPAEQRTVVTLKVWGELTFAEIATVLEIPANTAASRYRYGLTTLRQWLEEMKA